jgi:hypothetical protein
MFSAVSMGSPACSSCDTQSVIGYPDGQWFPDSEWTYYEAHIKFASGPEWENGVVEVWYGDEVKLSVSGVDNRNINHEGQYINHVSFSDYSAYSDSEVGSMWIDNVVISTERVGPIGGTSVPVVPEPPVNFRSAE